MKVFLISIIEIKPLPGSVLFEENPDIIGAFVDMVVPAGNEQDAEIKAIQILKEDKYEIIKFGQVGEFIDFMFDDPELEIQFKALAWDALQSGEISYGPFYSWTNPE